MRPVESVRRIAPRAAAQLARLAVLCAAAASPATAQRPGAPQDLLPPRLALDRWDDRDGLPQNSVYAIAQSADGYLWLGTQEGLARFDGARFTVFAGDDEYPPFVTALLATPDTALWVGTTEGLAVMRHDSLRHVAVPGEPRVTALFIDDQRRLLVGTNDGMLVSAPGDTAGFERVTGLGEGQVEAIARTRDGTYWVAGSFGIARLDPSRRRAVPLHEASGPPGAVLSLRAAPSGALWAGTGHGLYRSRGGGPFELIALEGRPAYAVLPPDGAEGLVVSGSRMMRIDTAGQLSQLPTSLSPGDLVVSLFRDREESLWLGTAGHGLMRLRRTLVATVGPPEGLVIAMAQPILEAMDGSMWIGTGGGGLNHFHGTAIDTFSVENGTLPSNYVISLAQTPDGTVWVGTGLGVVRMGREGTRRVTPTEGPSPEQVRVILPAPGGGVWMGGNRGLQRVAADGSLVRGYTTADGLADELVLSLEYGADGTLWIGSRTALNHMVGDTIRSWRSGPGNEVGSVMDMERDGQGRLWLATRSGLVRVDGEGDFHRYTHHVGLCDDQLHAVVADDAGRLWLSSNHGLAWLRPAELAAHDADPEGKLPCRRVGRAAGMRSREANGGVSPAAYRTRDGSLWFPTVEGVAVVDPDHVRLDLPPPPVVIEQVTSDGVALAGPAPTVAPGSQHLSFRFTGLSLVAPDQVRFRYRLDGFDPTWIESDGTRMAEYTNLRPGHYEFRVQAANADGQWTPTAASLPLVVRGYVWQSAWFQAAVVGLLVLGLFAGHRWRLRRANVRQAELFELERARVRAETLAVDARLRALRLELHPHFFFNTLNGVAGLIRDGNQRSALDVLGRFADLTRATLESRNEQTRPLGEELDYIRQYLDLECIRFGERLQARIDADDDALGVPVPPLILQPIVENALRHGIARVARDARLGLSAEVSNGSLHIRVADNGPGLPGDLDSFPNGTGLRNVRERLQALYGASAVVRSVPQDVGTTIELVIPRSGPAPN